MNALKRREPEIQAKAHLEKTEELVNERTKELQDTLRPMRSLRSWARDEVRARPSADRW